MAEPAEGGFVGLEVQGADPLARAALHYDKGFGGVLVRDVAPGGPADRAGLMRGDMIVGFEGVAVSGLQQILGYMRATAPGQAVVLDLWRHGGPQRQALVLDAWPQGWRVAANVTAVLPRHGLTVGSLTVDRRQAFGVRWGTVGVVVLAVEAEGPAAQAGLRDGDVILAAGRRPVVAPEALEPALAAMDDAWMVLVERGAEVLLAGPGAPRAERIVAGNTILAARLDDGPYVMDVALGGPALDPGSSVPEMPAPRVWPAPVERRAPDVGLTVASLSAELRRAQGGRWSSRGVAVTAVAPGSTAQSVGLVPGHVIHSLNQTPVEGPEDFTDRLAAATASHVLLVVETAQGFRLLSLSPRGRDAQAAPEVRPVFQFGG